LIEVLNNINKNFENFIEEQKNSFSTLIEIHLVTKDETKWIDRHKMFQ